MNLVLVGLNHKTAGVTLRECLAPGQDGVGGMLKELADLPGVLEAFLLATCNRVEALVVTSEGEAAGARVRSFFEQRPGADPVELEKSLYTHFDEGALRHLFRVASSLDSLVVGEPQILGQMKEAYREAVDRGVTSSVLNRLLHKTFQVAKKVRSETNIGGHAVSVSSAAVDLARKIFDPLEERSALLIGAGEMAELAAEHLMGNGVRCISVANRTFERAVAMAGRFGGRAYGMDDLPTALAESDIVISSTGSSSAVITLAVAKAALKKRKGRPIFFIDIAVPRDVEAAVGGLDGCFVYDMDDLSQVVQHNVAARADEAAAAERIVAAEVVKFSRWLSGLGVVPTIAALSAKAEEIREAEVARTLKDLNGAGAEQAQAMERLTKALVKKLLHDPIMFIKEAGHEKSHHTKQEQLALIRRAFNLPDPDGNGGELEEKE